MGGVQYEMMGNLCTPTYDRIVPKAIQISCIVGQLFRERVSRVFAPGVGTFFDKFIDIIYVLYARRPKCDDLLLGPVNVRQT